MTIRRRFLFLLPALIAFASFTLCFDPARAISFEEEAREFVQTLAEKAVRELTDKSRPREQRIQRFREYFNEHFAVRGIGKWILGRHWRKAEEAQQEEYLKLFEDLMVVSYVDRFAAYAGEPLRIQKALVQDENNITVFSNIPQQEGNPAIRIDWRVARKEGLYKVVDVVVEGTSMSNTLRSDFGSIIRQRGGKVAGLLEALREKTARLRTKGDN
ncbi:MAG: ABC transporter substrate-binding protein [Rhodospirillaceae bacterium]|nr:ABC transporter substrate-binding protein [Rhodospirillaceae bacterium]